MLEVYLLRAAASGSVVFGFVSPFMSIFAGAAAGVGAALATVFWSWVDHNF